ncbi:MAG: hypothetical protein Fur0010_02060 [Bdellovibrio sp.]
MKLVKNLLKWLLKKFGYDVIKIDSSVKRVVYCAHFRGHPFYCFKGDPLSESVLTGNGWDNQLSEILEHKLKGSAHVVEIGANIGTSFVTIANNFPQLTFDCHEPVPQFFDLLKKNFENFKVTNVKLFNQIFGEKLNTKIALNVGLGTAGASELSHYQQNAGTLILDSMTLDHAYHQKEFKFLKLDVDGYELPILKGGEQVLKKYRPYIFMEYSYKIMDSMGKSGYEILDFLSKLGYEKAEVWDSSGKFIKEVSQLSEIDSIARSCPHYADILLLPF